MNRLKEKVAVVTGAGSGMGAAISELFAQEGAMVCLLDMHEENGRKKEKKLLDAGSEVVFYKADITDRDGISGIFKQIFDKYGKINILVNNAGMMIPHGMADEVTENNENIARRMMEVNVFGTNVCSSEAIRYFRKSGGGSIINIGSLAALMVYKGDWAYIASKAGVMGLTRSYAVSYAEDNIRCNCILPSVVLTEGAIETVGMTGAVAEDLPNPMKKPISPLDIAKAALFFASDDAAVVNGQSLAVDAGFSVLFPDPY